MYSIEQSVAMEQGFYMRANTIQEMDRARETAKELEKAQEQESLQRVFSALVIFSTFNAALSASFISFVRDYFDITAEALPSKPFVHYAVTCGLLALASNLITATLAGPSAAVLTYHRQPKHLPSFRWRLSACLAAQVIAIPLLISSICLLMIEWSEVIGICVTVILAICACASIATMNTGSDDMNVLVSIASISMTTWHKEHEE